MQTITTIGLDIAKSAHRVISPRQGRMRLECGVGYCGRAVAHVQSSYVPKCGRCGRRIGAGKRCSISG
jgi:hypothetical protein